MSEQAKNPYDVAAVAEVLRVHQFDGVSYSRSTSGSGRPRPLLKCSCGWKGSGTHRAHVAEQVVALGGGAS